jgi:hypothetical protein
MALTAVAAADYVTDFEGFMAGTPVGFPLTGQDGFYIPSGTTSVDYLCYFYYLNGLSIPQNPGGGMIFVAGTGPGDGSTFARGQRDIVLTSGLWKFAYDFCGHFEGAAASNNLGSFSAQDAPNDWIHLFAWVVGQEGVLYTAGIMAYDAAGVQFPQPGVLPGPEWDNLELDHWYRSTMMVDFSTNQVVQVAIEDLETNVETVVNVVDWYLEGGSGGSTAPMTGFRFFAGAGANPGNSVAFDNLNIEEMLATPVLPATWGGIKAQFVADTPSKGSAPSRAGGPVTN